MLRYRRYKYFDFRLFRRLKYNKLRNYNRLCKQIKLN